MEANNSNQLINPSEFPAQSQPASTPVNNQRSYSSMILGVILLLLIVGSGAYYLGAQKNNTTNQMANTNRDTQTQSSPTEFPHISPSPTPVTWKTESVEIIKDSAVSGNENITLAFQLPTDWTLKTVSKTTNPDDMIETCADYVLSNNDGMAKLTVSPVCTGWGATYSDWPQGAVSVKEEANVGNDGHTAYIVRFFDSSANQYKYVEGEKGTSNKIMDAILIRYNPRTGNFLPINILLSSIGTNSEEVLATADKIVASIKAQ